MHEARNSNTEFLLGVPNGFAVRDLTQHAKEALSKGKEAQKMRVAIRQDNLVQTTRLVHEHKGI